MFITLMQPSSALIAAATNPGEVWLCCDDCRHFFQHQHTRPDAFGFGCPFCSESEPGIFGWDARRELDDPRWPTCTEDLAYGMRAPEMDEFYRARAERQRADIVTRFQSSPEWAALRRRDFPRWTEHLLWLFWTYSASPDQFLPELFAECMYDSFAFWSDAEPDDAELIGPEIRAYFAFAHRVLGFSAALGCLEAVSKPEYIEYLRDSITEVLESGERKAGCTHHVRTKSGQTLPEL